MWYLDLTHSKSNMEQWINNHNKSFAFYEVSDSVIHFKRVVKYKNNHLKKCIKKNNKKF